MPDTANAPSLVAAVPALPSSEALEHFTKRLGVETDCWDIHESLRMQANDFVILDVRGPDLYEEGHVPGAINLPHGKITERRMSEWTENTLFVVYCAGPHCNGANKAAIRLARLGRPVKEMIGGITGWIDEGFLLATGTEPSSVLETESASSNVL
ncbi:rhodanese-like domain protein [Fulvimarina pelagi HTCC2506]|uniref:Rhodanese-like domain protein n=1 Tax=Fulvimarina pelagi HTCC2506 TaxID=314231 RepID=Q0G0Q9_9HYPH|nr:rhodanese-like domain-containing protein [Fulvimarina pelagi]EAU40930.1 rhodanese-like domain protein [Fulvimarina pelagi HTCC2506]